MSNWNPLSLAFPNEEESLASPNDEESLACPNNEESLVEKLERKVRIEEYDREFGVLVQEIFGFESEKTELFREKQEFKKRKHDLKGKPNSSTELKMIRDAFNTKNKEFKKKTSGFANRVCMFLNKHYEFISKNAELRQKYEDLQQEIKRLVIEDLHDNNSTGILNEKFLMEINEELKIHPRKFYQIDKETREKILHATRNLSDGKCNVESFKKEFGGVCKDYRIKFECQREEGKRKFCEAFCVHTLDEIEIGGNFLFSSLEPHHVDRMTDLMNHSIKRDHQRELFAIGKKFSELQSCVNPQDFFSLLEFVCQYLQEKKEEKENQYTDEMTSAKETNENFNRGQYDIQYGIIGNRNKHFFKEVVQGFIKNEQFNDEAFSEMGEVFRNLEISVIEENSKCSPKFQRNNAATYHYYKHRNWKGKELTPEEYFAIARELTGEPMNERNSILGQEANCTYITYIDSSNGAVCILVDKDSQNGPESIIATLMYVKAEDREGTGDEK